MRTLFFRILLTLRIFYDFRVRRLPVSAPRPNVRLSAPEDPVSLRLAWRWAGKMSCYVANTRKYRKLTKKAEEFFDQSERVQKDALAGHVWEIC